MSRAGVLIAACLVGCLVVESAPLAADQAEDAAQAAAESWLRVVDGGDYAGSWSQAARPLRGAVKQGDWAELVGSARTPLGGLVSRKLKSRELTEKPPTTRVIGGRVYTLADAKYVVVQYDSAFAGRASAVETVIAMTDADGAWRVSGYSLR